MNYARIALLVVAAIALVYLGFEPLAYVTIAIIVCYYLLNAIGWNVVGGFAYLPSFAQAAFATLASYISAGFVAYTGTFVPVGVVFAVLAITAISYGLGYVTLKMTGAYLALATIAFSEGVRVTLAVNPSYTGGDAGYFPPPLVPSWTTPDYYYLFVVITVISIYFTHRLMKSSTGTMMIAVGNDEEAAVAMGIDVRRIRLIAFTISGVFGGIAGTLYGHYLGVIVPNDGSLLEMATMMTGPIIGGLGTFTGPIIGTLVVIGIRQYMLAYVGPYDVLIFGLLMVFGMRFMKNGIIGVLRSRRLRSLLGKSPPASARALPPG